MADLMPNSNELGPLDPIFDVEKSVGAIVIGNSYPVTYIDRVAFDYYWDFSNTANWTGALLTGQNPEVGNLAMKQIDFANGMGLSTINGLTCAANVGGFLSVRGEWGTDASLPTFDPPLALCGTYQRIVSDGNQGVCTAIATYNVPGGSGATPYITTGIPNVGSQVVGTAVTSLVATTAPADTSPHAVFFVVEDPNSELWVDGVLEATGSVGLGNIVSGRRVTVITSPSADGGGPASGGGIPNSKWGEGGLHIGTHPSATQIINWFTDVMTKWGV